ncbi:unnamed protein product [Calypogeia fissa]
MAVVEKHHVLGLVIWLAILDLVLLALAGYCFDKLVDGALAGVNGATYSLIIVSLVAGLLLVAAIIAGGSHFHHYSSGSVGSASTTALIAWVVMLLAFGFACKQIDLGGTASRTQALEAFVFILTFFETIYVLILYGGLFNPKFGVGYS